MTKNQNLEPEGIKKVERDYPKEDRKVTLEEKAISDGLGAIPPILGCTALVYVLGISGEISQFVESSLQVNKLDFGFHLSAGSGLYGGYTLNANRKIASLLTLAVSFVPEIIMIAQDGDLKRIGASSTAKLVGYGLGYLLGRVAQEY
ncbi:hypothetical protein HY486_02200 [Candidatus Woesearchaeota archaeon]|nr:hypothetical protein [Candidatus Woesearchaeota archaeon]